MEEEEDCGARPAQAKLASRPYENQTKAKGLER
jgi:hypothetical protein